jgi:hypothetical protein
MTAPSVREALLPCPFCGSEPILREKTDYGHQPVECPNKDCCMSHMWPDVREWQKLAAPPSEIPLPAEVKIVPREPTREMLRNAELLFVGTHSSENAYWSRAEIWRAMHDAAPTESAPVSEREKKLHDALRDEMIHRAMDDGWLYGNCAICHGAWHGDIEQHATDCLAAPMKEEGR